MGFWSFEFLYDLHNNHANPVEGWKEKGISPLPTTVDTGVSIVTKDKCGFLLHGKIGLLSFVSGFDRIEPDTKTRMTKWGNAMSHDEIILEVKDITKSSPWHARAQSGAFQSAQREAHAIVGERTGGQINAHECDFRADAAG